jgi:hypothetical protein
MKRGLILLATGLLLAGCGAPQSSLTVKSGETANNTVVSHATNLRGVRYCEILVVTGTAANIRAAVYNTAGLNDCPEAQWNALKPDTIKKQFNAVAVIMNGPRYFLMDSNALANPGQAATFGELGTHLVATLNLPAGSLLTGLKRIPYTENSVDRDTQYVFLAGKPIFELVAPDGKEYVMQSYAQTVDPTLNEAALSTLAERLKLPANWTYRVKTLEADLLLRTVGGKAHVIQDDFENTYQRLDG